MGGEGGPDRDREAIAVPGRAKVNVNMEKTLEELTQEDIMQLTREDCRRYLKEKGMRRPSWNKSQAIQQVLSLKNLFDSRPDDEENSANENVEEAPFNFSTQERPPVASNSNSDSKYLESMRLDWLAEAHLPVLARQPPSIGRQNFSSLSSRSWSWQKQSGAQLTIFYSGNVNVYDNVPAEKAQAIMLLAGGPNYLPAYSSTAYSAASPNSCQNIVQTAYPSNPTNISANNGPASISAAFGKGQTQTLKETPLTRKASLQRFLEKKKDRSRCKGAAATTKRPLLMGMFMHPSYCNWNGTGTATATATGTSLAKKKATKPNATHSHSHCHSHSHTLTPPTTPPDNEQAATAVCSATNFGSENNCTEPESNDISLHNSTSSETQSTSV